MSTSNVPEDNDFDIRSTNIEKVTLPESVSDVSLSKEVTPSPKRISFPVDSILNAVIQESDVIELFRILRHQRSEIDLNQTNHTGLTALHYAVLTNNQDTVKLLLNHGADVSVQDIYGFSPLHTAAALGFLHITSMLIMFGADIFSLTKQSEYPIDVAKDIAVVRILSHEMCQKAHSETYFKAVVRLRLHQLFKYLWSWICYVYMAVLSTAHRLCQLIVTYRRNRTLQTRNKNMGWTTKPAKARVKDGDQTNCNQETSLHFPPPGHQRKKTQ